MGSDGGMKLKSEIYFLHPCVSSLGGIPIFVLKNAKEFLVAVSAVDHRIKTLNCNLIPL